MSSRQAFRIVKDEVDKFLSYAAGQHTYTFRAQLYVKELYIELENLEPTNRDAPFTPLDELLIRMNFNSSGYIHFLCEKLAALLNSVEKPPDKMKSLLFYFKSFRQVKRKPGMIFNSRDADLHKQVSNWFRQELSYLKKQIQYADIFLKANSKKKIIRNKVAEKILFQLSVDQIALILRAADALKVIVAPSSNSVFKAIVPHLSTPGHEDISYDSMRSKPYSAELRDKEIVIHILQQMIKTIREY